MTPLIIYAVILFTAALFFYTVGVWSERIGKRLKSWHVNFFLLGVLTDASATWLMFENLGYIKFTAHTVSGFIALFLMIYHYFWALIVLKRNNEQQLTSFHKFSIFVWGVWMISYLSGMVLGMRML
ncbi:MAG: TIGR03987 family protein [Gammaproteobacteria bacterium]|nr:MAG: TIGR03987 family protein [Gammaproteobacteria bacterium]